jgi:hypothetical protein
VVAGRVWQNRATENGGAQAIPTDVRITWKSLTSGLERTDGEALEAVRGSLRLPAFRRLTFAYGLGQLGDWLLEVALAVIVFDRTHSALMSGALFLGIRFLPALGAPALVARVERFTVRTSLAGLSGGRAAALTAIALAGGRPAIVLVVALGALDGVLAIASRGIVRRATAALFPGDAELRAGNAVLNVVFSSMAAVGPALAGILMVREGARGTIALDAALLALASASLLLTPIRQRGGSGPDRGGRALDGFRYALRHPVLKRLLIAQAVAIAFFTAVIPVEVVYAKTTLHAGDMGYGALLTSWGAGMVLGSLVFAAAGRLPLRPLLLVSTATVAIAYAGSAVAPSLLVACIAAVVGGAGNGVQWVALVCATQRTAGEMFQARVMALLESLAVAMPGVGFLIGGVVTAIASPRTSFVVAAGGIAAVIVAGFARRLDAPVAAVAGSSAWPQQGDRSRPLRAS